MYVIFSSYGNDSIALIQWAHDHNLKDVHVVYSDTGWASDFWPDRVLQGEKWASSLGFTTHRTESEGMESLVRRKKAWPRGGGGKFQFCTGALKIIPALEWLDKNDVDKNATCMNGKRRSESRARRNMPEWTTASKDHGDRELWAPLVRHNDEERDALIKKTPLNILPHRSKECWPCVNETEKRLKHLEENRIDRIDCLEIEMGTNSKGNKRVMFSPKRHGGAVGIKEIVNRAKDGNDDLFPVTICDSGWCG